MLLNWNGRKESCLFCRIVKSVKRVVCVVELECTQGNLFVLPYWKERKVSGLCCCAICNVGLVFCC